VLIANVIALASYLAELFRRAKHTEGSQRAADAAHVAG
jgi:hypothetical protein